MFNGQLTLKTVAPEFTERVWRDGAHVLGDVMPHDECTPDQLKYRITHGELTLLVVLDEAQEIHGYLAVAVHQSPNSRVLHIEAIHAPGCPSVAFEQLADYARSLGCTALDGYCSPAVAKLWAKTLGFKTVYTLSRKEI